MHVPLYQVDAFTSELFHGNPAAVCPLEAWLPPTTMQAIAAENNLSETAFFVHESQGYAIRWFTPVGEIDLCGHATLASAFVYFHFLDRTASTVTFSSASGPLTVARDGDLLVMDFPSRPPQERPLSPALATALGRPPIALAEARDYLAIYDNEDEVRTLTPDFALLKAVGPMVIVTAPGRSVDFVSRFFAPGHGIEEDPVTGSAHCTLIPYWAQRLGKRRLHARQVSARGGELFCEDSGDRVRIGGHAVLYLDGAIRLPA
jgi:PhzF family phenazine biosynthesis protein